MSIIFMIILLNYYLISDTTKIGFSLNKLDKHKLWRQRFCTPPEIKQCRKPMKKKHLFT